MPPISQLGDPMARSGRVKPGVIAEDSAGAVERSLTRVFGVSSPQRSGVRKLELRQTGRRWWELETVEGARGLGSGGDNA